MQIPFCTIFQICQIATFARPVGIRSSQCSTFWHIKTFFRNYPGILKHIQELSRDIQTHSEACLTLLYSEPLHIQNPRIFRIRAISRTLIYSGPPRILTTLSSICDRVFYENNANSFLLYFQIWQVATLVVPVAIRLNQWSTFVNTIAFKKSSLPPKNS